MKKLKYIIGIALMFFYSINIISQENKLALIDINNPICSIKNNTPSEKLNYEDWNILLKKNVSPTGKVNYKGFKTDIKKLNEFLRTLSNTVITENWTKPDKISYWINVYNAYTIKLIVNNYPLTSIKKINNPWKKKFFSINNKAMSLGEVEHQILRKFNDPRIHFAINCASTSCPRLIQVAYNSKNLEHLLERQTTEFINNSFYNTITEYTVNISKLFDWYKKDFKAKSGSVVNFINQYSKISIDKQKERGYKSYDWSLNSLK